jgi:hypothetical protein
MLSNEGKSGPRAASSRPLILPLGVGSGSANFKNLEGRQVCWKKLLTGRGIPAIKGAFRPFKRIQQLGDK